MTARKPTKRRVIEDDEGAAKSAPSKPKRASKSPDDPALARAVDLAHKLNGVMLLGSAERVAVETISSGSLTLDVATGVGGFPRGRIVEIAGVESSGKTTLALEAISAVQEHGELVAFIDAEHALDPDYARAIGVNVDRLLFAQPDCGEQALELVEDLLGEVGLVVVDSVAALVPKAEIDGEMGDSYVGLHARLMSQAMRKIAGKASKTRTTVVFINQVRDKIGIVYGPKETTTGGRALKFYSTIRVDVRRVGGGSKTTAAGAEPKEVVTRARIIKNKVAPPFRDAQFRIIFGKGVDREGELFDLGVRFGAIEKSGSWFALADGTRLGNGRELSIAAIRELDVAGQILKALEPELRRKGA